MWSFTDVETDVVRSNIDRLLVSFAFKIPKLWLITIVCLRIVWFQTISDDFSPFFPLYCYWPDPHVWAKCCCRKRLKPVMSKNELLIEMISNRRLSPKLVSKQAFFSSLLSKWFNLKCVAYIFVIIIGSVNNNSSRKHMGLLYIMVNCLYLFYYRLCGVHCEHVLFSVKENK